MLFYKPRLQERQILFLELLGQVEKARFQQAPTALHSTVTLPPAPAMGVDHVVQSYFFTTGDRAPRYDPQFIISCTQVGVRIARVIQVPLGSSQQDYTPSPKAGAVILSLTKLRAERVLVINYARCIDREHHIASSETLLSEDAHPFDLGSSGHYLSHSDFSAVWRLTFAHSRTGQPRPLQSTQPSTDLRVT